MRCLMLSWEYPPVIVGGLGRHVHALATSLAAAGHEVTVVTRHAPGSTAEEFRDGVHIVRAPEDPPLFALDTPTLLAWTMAFNHTLTRAALRAAASGKYDVIHAHDWLVTHTAVTLSEYLNLPLVATIHATEAGRHQGWLPGEMNRSIHSVEWWLGHRACRVLVCSEYMKCEVTRLFDLPADRIEVIPNGVNGSAWQVTPRAIRAARNSLQDTTGPLIGYAGRLVYEKGVQDLVEAVPLLRDRYPRLKVVIAGDGPYRSDLQAATRRLRLSGTVHFAGFLPDYQLAPILAATDATVVPSLYEPFGMVALEAAAAGAPLAVAATGGLTEIVKSGVNGVTFPHGDPAALAAAVDGLVAEPEHAQRLARQAQLMVSERFSWRLIAGSVISAYHTAIALEPSTLAERLAECDGRVVVPDGNLLG